MALEIVDTDGSPTADAPAGGTQDQAPDGKEETLEIVVNGQAERFDLRNPEHRQEIVRRAQQGTHYSQKAEALNSERVRLLREHKPFMEFDELLKRDPELNAMFTAAIRGEPLPGPVRPARRPPDDDPDADDPNRGIDEVEGRLRRDFQRQEQGLVRLVSTIDQRLNAMAERDLEREDEARIRNHPTFKGFVKDDHIAMARERRRDKGGSLYDNFILLYAEEIPRIVARNIRSELPPDVRRTMLTRESGPIVIDGEVLTEERLKQLQDNPDEYQKYKKAIRAAKRRRRGLIPVPGRE
jgi:hypothetical protein